MIIYLIKVLFCSLIFWLIYHILLQKETFFERNRFYLLSATLLSILIPLANWQTWWSVSDSSNLLPYVSTIFLQEIEIGKSTANFQINWATIIPYIAMCFTALYLLYIVYGIRKLVKLAKISKQEKYPNYTLVQVDRQQYPFSFLNYLFWGNKQRFSDKETQKILQHELAHINGKHSYDIIFIELICAIFWFNPFFYLFKKYLKEQHEYIADASVYNHGAKSDYARLMVNNTLKSLDLGSGLLPNTSIQLTHNFYQSPILKRLEMMNKSRTPIVKNFKLLVIIPALAAITFLYACEGVETTESIVEDIVKKSDKEALSLIKDKIDKDGTYILAHQSAEPVGGYESFYKYVAQNMKYPKQAQRLGVQGKVYVQFVVDKDGTIIEETALKGIGAGCDAEAMRVITESDKWTPAMNAEGEFVKQRIVLPINFKLE